MVARLFATDWLLGGAALELTSVIMSVLVREVVREVVRKVIREVVRDEPPGDRSSREQSKKEYGSHGTDLAGID